MLKGQEGAQKHQHYHIKQSLTKSLTHTFSISSFVGVSPQYLHPTHLTVYIYTYLLSYESEQTHTPTNFTLPTPNNRHLAWTLCGQQETAVFFSPTVQQQVISHCFFYSLTAFSSLRLPVVFPFEADLISHIRTSILLKRAEYDGFDPFHMRKVRPAQPATLKREVFFFFSFFSIASSKSPLGWHGNAASHLHRLTTMCLQT